jgi:hypothetical protein
MTEQLLVDTSRQYENEIINRIEAFEHQEPPKSPKNVEDFTYTDYLEKPDTIVKYKIPQLKVIAKRLRQKVTGNKRVLISRILNHYNSIKYATRIQRIFRGHIVRLSFKLRGAGFKNRKGCVNETDFCTLEPVDEIPDEYFFSYTNKDITYGFNLISLIQLLKSSNKIINPYNREVFSSDIVLSIIQLFRLINIIFPDAAEKNGLEKPNITNNNIYNIILNRQYSQNAASSLRERLPRMVVDRSHTNNMVLAGNNGGTGSTIIQQNNEYINIRNERTITINNIRLKPIQTRIRDMFMDIDQLGNYTSSSWFSELDRRELIRLYRTLYDIWNYRSQLSPEMKRNICVLGGPFYGFPNITAVYHTFEQIQSCCLMIFENLVYTGIDDEHRKIGVLHALTALTVVSLNARNAMMWLYDSVAY